MSEPRASQPPTTVTADRVERFLKGGGTAAETRDVVRAALLAAGDDSDIAPALAPTPDVDVYGAAFERAARRAHDFAVDVAAERETADELLAELHAELDREPAELLERRVRGDARYHSWALVQILCRASLAAGFDDARRAVALAHLAVAAGDAIEGGPESPPLRHDLRGLAHAHLGNALRVASDLRAAGRVLRLAAGHLAQGTGDPHSRAWLRSFEVSLESDRSHFEEALELSRRGIHLARLAGDRHLEGRLRIQRATLLAYRDDVVAAIATLERGLEQVDVAREPRLVLIASHNLISYLEQAGRPEEALARVPATRELAAEFGRRLDRIRLRWLEGRVLLRLGREDEGARALRATCDAFLEQEIGYDAALVCLELALFHAARGERGRVARLAEEMLPVFASRDVHREAQAALQLFRDAARAEAAEHELVAAVLRYLEHARERPDLPFEPPR